jgi:hypothetical protein
LLANALLAPNPTRATVVGLTGAWGTGKSSVANMIVEYIGNAAAVVQFEPWIVTTREALAREFFTTLGKTIFPKSDSKDEQKARERFYRYASQALGLVEIGADSAGLVVPGIGLVGRVAKGTKKALALAADGLETLAKEPTLRQARDKIAKDLQSLKKPIVFVIDDIDRLDRDEVRITFQIIKACADFPNVRYLLLYDRAQVLHALENTVNDPSAFLEKIVNQVFDLPEVTTKQRALLLDDCLTLLGLHEKLERNAKERLSMLFDEVLLPGLPTVRHIKRFVNTVQSLLPGVIVDGHFNIDPTDFLALEYLRQSTPSFYSVLREEGAPQPGGRVARVVRREELPKEREARRKATLDDIKEPLKSLAKEAYNSIATTGTSDARSHADKRFATDYWRPVYFGFCDDRARIRESDWMNLHPMLESGDPLCNWLQSWEDRELRDRWTMAIIARASELDQQQSLKLMTLLLDWSETRSYEQGTFPSGPNFSYDESVRLCCEACLDVSSHTTSSVDVLTQAITSSKCALVVPAFLLGFEQERVGKNNRSGDWSSGESLTELSADLSQRLAVEIECERVWTMPDPRRAIIAWHYLAPKAQFNAWHEKQISDPIKLARYLNIYHGCQRHDVNQMAWQSDPKELQAYRILDLTLLDENGLWARKHYLDSAKVLG